MKKLLLAAFGLGIVAVSCGTKESTMSTKNSDSAAVNTQTIQPATTDTASVKKMNPDPATTKVDSTATVVPAK